MSRAICKLGTDLSPVGANIVIRPKLGLAPKTRFSATAIDDVIADAEPPWAIEGLLPARGLAVIVGAPKSGKSFLLTDAMFAVARGAPYAGRDTMQGPVFYCTGEGVSGFRRRLVAMRRHYGFEGQSAPFFVIENVPDLGSERTADVDALIVEIAREIKERRLPSPRAIVLDTAARCMGDGDENSARDMGRFVTGCGRIERAFGCLIAVVHHTGKDATRGGRGSNALTGALDCEWTVENTSDVRRARVSRMKDGPSGDTWTFALKQVKIESQQCAARAGNCDASTCVVEIMAEPRRTETSKPRTAVAGKSAALLEIIKSVIEDAGQTNDLPADVPIDTPAIKRAFLKVLCIQRSWLPIAASEQEASSGRAVFSNNLSVLRTRGFLGFNNDWVWLTPC